MSDDKLKSLIDLYSNIKSSEDSTTNTSKSDLEPLLKAFIATRSKSEKNNLSKEEKIELLQKRFSAFTVKNKFNVGDLVKWKSGLRNKGGIKYEDTAIVVDVLDTPIFDQEKDSGSPYFREPLDIVIAFLDSDNDFVILHVDSRRMQPVSKGPNRVARGL